MVYSCVYMCVCLKVRVCEIVIDKRRGDGQRGEEESDRMWKRDERNEKIVIEE